MSTHPPASAPRRVPARGILVAVLLPATFVLGLRTGTAAGGSASFCLHVAPGGADANPGTATAPLATIEGARDAIRGLKRAGRLPAGGVEVLVHGGTYELMRTFRLGPEDSGAQGAPIIYRAHPGQRAVLVGGRRVGDFRPHKGAILKTALDAQGVTHDFRQLFVDGKRMQLARYPNHDPINPNGGFAYVDGVPPKDSDKYKENPAYPAREIHLAPPDVRTWAHPAQGEVIYFPWHNWLNIGVPIAAVDPARRVIVLTRDAKTHEGYPGGIRPGDRYYVRGLFEELDAPGEWYLDRATRTLYLWPPKLAGTDAVYAPMVTDIVALDPGTAWVTVRGFALECCDGYAVALRGATDCLVAGNSIRNAAGGRIGGGGGVLIDGGARCGVAGNDIWDVGDTGITLRGGDRRTLTPAGHWADNNYLHHIGVLNGHGHGVRLDGVGLRVSHNLIHDITRSSIFGGGNDCVIEFNHIRHDNLMTEDTAGYYCGGNWHKRGAVIRHNYVHDTLGYGRRNGRWITPNFSWGIYLDDDHSGALVYGNIVARTPLGGVMIHAGRDNIVENNILIDGARAQLVMSGHDPKRHEWLIRRHRDEFVKYRANPAYAKYPEVPALDPENAWHMAGNRFQRNIVCYRAPDSPLYRRSADFLEHENRSDHNLVWHFGLPISIAQTGPENAPKEQSWEQWQKRGFDRHSIVADPLFVDAARDDYRLRPESPAFALGFKPIPVDRIGPYKDDLRASWPLVEAEGVREHPLPAEAGPLWPGPAPVGEGGPPEPAPTKITVYLPPPATATGAAIVICPGGGYQRHVTWYEGDPIARWLTGHGIAGIVLEYRLPQGRPFLPLLDAQRAIRTARANAPAWNLDPTRVGIMGFSAGGHLASTAGTHFDGGDSRAPDPIDRVGCRPDFMVLVYPVVTMGASTHGGSRTNLLGSEPSPEHIALFSNERQVSAQTPPAFLVHASDDVAVPPANSRAFVAALETHGVPVEYLELPRGGHGLNKVPGPMWEQWQQACIAWMTGRGILRRTGHAPANAAPAAR